MSDEQTSGLNVVVVSFDEDSKAYEALTSLKELDSQRQLELRAAAVVVRDDDGKVIIKDEVGESYGVGTATGGIIGLLIGIIGGPLGVLIGGATGLMAGSLFDLDEEFDTRSALSQISHSVKVGHTALVAEVSEPSPEVLDSDMARLSGKVLRHPGARGRSGDRRRARGPARSGEGCAQAAAQGAQRAAPEGGRREDRGAQGEAPPAQEGDHGTEHLSGRTRVGQDRRRRRHARAVGTGTPAVSGRAECSPIRWRPHTLCLHRPRSSKGCPNCQGLKV